MNSFQMIFKYWLKSKKFFIVQVIFLTFSTIFSLIVPIFIGLMVGGLEDGSTTPETKSLNLIYYLLLILGFAFLAFLDILQMSLSLLT